MVLQGLPDGCQVEQVHTLQRHSQRFPTSYYDDGPNDERLAAKVANFTKNNANASFTGPLAFLNSYQYKQAEGFLTGLGAETEFASGVSFWNAYGRTCKTFADTTLSDTDLSVYNASIGQLQYDPSFENGMIFQERHCRRKNNSRYFPLSKKHLGYADFQSLFRHCSTKACHQDYRSEPHSELSDLLGLRFLWSLFLRDCRARIGQFHQ